MRYNSTHVSEFAEQNEETAIGRLISLIGLIFDKHMRKRNILYLYRARVLALETITTDSSGKESCTPGCYVTVKIVDKNADDNTENLKINNLRNCTGEILVAGDFVYVSTNGSDIINSQNSFVSAKI